MKAWDDIPNEARDDEGFAEPLRPLLLGEAPSRLGDRYHAFPLSGAPAMRLCEWAGISSCDEEGRVCAPYWALIEHFDTLNTIERYGDAYPWRAEVARERVRAYLAENPIEVIVAVGVKAWNAVVGHPPREVSWGTWYMIDGRRVAAIPHTSGRNLLYNDPAMRELAGRVLREAMAGAGGARRQVAEVER